MNSNTLEFLKTLEENNHRSWMEENKGWFVQVKSEFAERVAEILAELKIYEPEMDPLQVKDCVFRQNRDIRFSPNKMPYKTNMAAYFCRGGKKSEGPGYYLHIQPGKSFVGGGLYHPPAQMLKQLRQEIDYSGDELKGILAEKSFKERFSGLQGEQLKTSPRDYDADHPHIDFLRCKSFEVFRPITDEQIKNEQVVDIAVDAFIAMQPYMEFLYRATDSSESGEGLL
jgi:uncharacterized protein (TIGR02453 family)